MVGKPWIGSMRVTAGALAGFMAAGHGRAGILAAHACLYKQHLGEALRTAA
jgi:uncharacterized protein (DUF433 family)